MDSSIKMNVKRIRLQKDIDTLESDILKVYPDRNVIAISVQHKDLYVRAWKLSRKLFIPIDELMAEMNFNYKRASFNTNMAVISAKLNNYFKTDLNATIEDIKAKDAELFSKMQLYGKKHKITEIDLLSKLKGKYIEKYIKSDEYSSCIDKDTLLKKIQDIVTENKLTNFIDLKNLDSNLCKDITRMYRSGTRGSHMTARLEEDGIVFAKMDPETTELRKRLTSADVLYAITYYNLYIKEFLRLISISESASSNILSQSTICTYNKAKEVLSDVASKIMSKEVEDVVLHAIISYNNVYTENGATVIIAKAKDNTEDLIIITKVGNKVELFVEFSEKIKRKLTEYGFYKYFRNEMEILRHFYNNRNQMKCEYKSPTELYIEEADMLMIKQQAGKLANIGGVTVERLKYVGIYLDPKMILRSRLHYTDDIFIDLIKQYGGRKEIGIQGAKHPLYHKLWSYSRYKGYYALPDFLDYLERQNNVLL